MNEIDPGQGWRLIDKEKDFKKPGDEYFDYQNGWRPAGCGIGFLKGHTYRRRIELYSIGTWDARKQSYTPQRGLSVPSFNITRGQLRRAMKELRKLGYSVHRYRAADGTHDDNDWCVLIERTDGKHWKSIMSSWKR